MLERVKRQEKFKVWPLHLTLVPWFDISGNNLSGFRSAMSVSIAGTPKITLIADGSDYFGPQKVSVTLIKPTSELLNLHQKLLDILLDCDAKLLAPKHIGQNFLPHVTHRGEKGPSHQQTVCSELAVVAKCDDGDRQLVETLAFSKR